MTIIIPVIANMWKSPSAEFKVNRLKYFDKLLYLKWVGISFSIYMFFEKTEL